MTESVHLLREQTSPSAVPPGSDDQALCGSLEQLRESGRSTLVEVLRDISSLAWIIAPGARLEGRIKSVPSMLFKLRGNRLDPAQLSDSIGVRIIMPSTAQCYRLFAGVHGRFEVLTGEDDDYIKCPKANGYRSLHTTILATNGRRVEVQVRTPRMHAQAETGSASHRLYKRQCRASWGPARRRPAATRRSPTICSRPSRLTTSLPRASGTCGARSSSTGR